MCGPLQRFGKCKKAAQRAVDIDRAGAKEVVMLDYEPLALQCALLSAEASGLTSVQDYRQHQQVGVTAAAPAPLQEPTHPETAHEAHANGSPSPAEPKLQVSCHYAIANIKVLPAHAYTAVELQCFILMSWTWLNT